MKLKDLIKHFIKEEIDKFSNLYPKTGKNSPDLVKKAIEQFRKLSVEERSKQPLLYYLLGESTPNFKMSKKDSEYVDKSNVSGQTCKNCYFLYKRVRDGKYICSQVNENDSPNEGSVSLNGWCRLWKSMKKE